jgi:hypothetical protein
MGKVSQNVSSLKPLAQLKPNCPGRSSTKYRFFMPIGNPRWPPLQEIDNIGPYGKMFKCLLFRNYKYD